jgi:plasmid stability protein
MVRAADRRGDPGPVLAGIGGGQGLCIHFRFDMETNMATIVLKEVPVELWTRLEERARASGRSVEREVIACLESVVATARPSRTAEEERQTMARVRAFREQLAAEGFSITDEEITAWKKQGRP